MISTQYSIDEIDHMMDYLDLDKICLNKINKILPIEFDRDANYFFGRKLRLHKSIENTIVLMPMNDFWRRKISMITSLKYGEKVRHESKSHLYFAYLEKLIHQYNNVIPRVGGVLTV